MSNALATHSGRARWGLVLCGGSSTDENRDEQRHDDDHGAVMSSTDSSTGMPSSAPFVEQLNPETEDATGSPTVDHHSALEDMDASDAFLRMLAGMNDDEVLASILRLRHRADVHRDLYSPELQDETLPAVDCPATVEVVQTTTGTEAGCSQTAPPTSLDSQVDTGDQHPAAQQDGKVTDCQEHQLVMAPDDAETSQSRKLTRAGRNENEALLDKRRRVRSEAVLDSPTASRLRHRAPLGTIINASSSTAATLTTFSLYTTAASARLPAKEGAAIVEPTARVTNGPDEMAMANQPCGRAEPAPDVHRSKHFAILVALARKRAAAAVRAVVKAAPVPRRRTTSAGGCGDGGAEARA